MSTPDLSSSDQHALTGVYVADALSEPERRDFEAHLRRCADCAQEVAELQETVALLASAEYVTPPSELRARVLAEASRTRQLPPVVTRISRRQDQTRSKRSAWPVAIAAVLALIFGGLAGGLALQNRSLTSDLSDVQAASASVRSVLTAPDARTTSAAASGGGRGAVVSSASLGRSVFVGSDLPAVSSAKTYQIWFVTAAGATSAGVVGSDVAGDITRALPAAPAGTTAVAVSVEPAGGSRAPTTTPVLALPTA